MLSQVCRCNNRIKKLQTSVLPPSPWHLGTVYTPHIPSPKNILVIIPIAVAYRESENDVYRAPNEMTRKYNAITDLIPFYIPRREEEHV